MTEEEIEKQASAYNDNWSKQGFIDGAKWMQEHATEWHEIKCCSQDLPPRSKDNFLHSVFVSNEYGEPIYYDYNIDEWCNVEDDIVSEDYKHWCELPQFKDKE